MFLDSESGKVYAHLCDESYRPSPQKTKVYPQELSLTGQTDLHTSHQTYTSTGSDITSKLYYIYTYTRCE
jgi:hypothetical protein